MHFPHAGQYYCFIYNCGRGADVGDGAVDLVYRRNDGSLGQQLLYADALDNITAETDELPWQFDADAEQVRLASEAYRIRLAHLFDPHLAVHTSR